MHFTLTLALARWLRACWLEYNKEYTEEEKDSLFSLHVHVSRVSEACPGHFRITMDKPGPAANPNGSRAHHFAVAAERKRTRNKARELTLLTYSTMQHNRPLYPDQFTQYRYIWDFFGTTQPDDDNVIARCKSIKDGICDALGLNDRNLRNKGVTFTRSKDLKGTVTILLK